jgi:hypothetical protein
VRKSTRGCMLSLQLRKTKFFSRAPRRTDRGMTSPNVAKVETNLQKLVIGILYQVHKKYLPGEDHGQDRRWISYGAKKPPLLLPTAKYPGTAINLPDD